MTPLVEDYAQAVGVAGLSDERQTRLMTHLLSLNAALPSVAPVAPAVARSAAALMAADPDHLAGPTAVAQAEALARMAQLGPALMQIQAGVMALEAAGDVPADVTHGPHAAGLQRILWHLIGEASKLLERMG
jgi:hypothetical protein